LQKNLNPALSVDYVLEARALFPNNLLVHLHLLCNDIWL